jgi:hypothetical protein
MGRRTVVMNFDRDVAKWEVCSNIGTMPVLTLTSVENPVPLDFGGLF